MKCCVLVVFMLFSIANLTHGAELLNINWESVTYVEAGSALFNSKVKTPQLCNLTFNPNLCVVYTNLSFETESLYIKYPHINSTAFYIHSIHSEIAFNESYKLTLANSTDVRTKIEKCVKKDSCNILTSCSDITILSTEETISGKIANDTIYVSWKNNYPITSFILQYKNTRVKCTDKNPFKSNVKLTAENYPPPNSNHLTMCTNKYKYKKTNKADKWGFNEKFDLNANQSIYLQILQCIQCVIKFDLVCTNYHYTTSLDYKTLMIPNVLHNYEWQELIIPLEKQNTTLEGCTLNVTTFVQSTSNSEIFWILGQSIITQSINYENLLLPGFSKSTLNTAYLRDGNDKYQATSKSTPSIDYPASFEKIEDINTKTNIILTLIILLLVSLLLLVVVYVKSCKAKNQNIEKKSRENFPLTSEQSIEETNTDQNNS